MLVDLVFELVAGPAHAGAGRVAALDHEVLDHAVEDDAVVETVVRELEEVLDRLRCVGVEELDPDRAVVRLEGRRRHDGDRTSAGDSRRARPGTENETRKLTVTAAAAIANAVVYALSVDAATTLAEIWLPSEPPIVRTIVFIPVATPVSSARTAATIRFAIAPNADRKSTRLNSSHVSISYAVFCLKKK